MTKRLLILMAIGLTNNANAQDIPPLPGAIPPGARDTSYFVCNVANVNEDIMQMSGRGNFWTRAATGGKFHAVSPIVVRVTSESKLTATQDLYSFYKQYAAAAFIRSPWYDRGTRLNLQSLVKSCEIDTSRVTNTNLKAVPLDEYKLLKNGQEHSLNFVKLTKVPLSDETVAKLTLDKPLSSDAFTRREQIETAAKYTRTAAASAAGPYIILEGTLFLGEYSFEKNSFDLEKLQQSAQKYAYLSKTGSFASMPPPYELSIPAKMSAYRPSSIEEAKKIEKARSELPYMKLRSYVQITDAKVDSNGNLVFKGTVAAIEVRNTQGVLMFTLRVQ